MGEAPDLNDAILKVEDAHTYIGHHHILQGLSFEASADAVTVLIGRNGAGKSTTLRTVMGLLPASMGRIIFEGQEIQRKKPYEIARLGLGFVPEEMGIFANLTVEENMRVAMLVEDEATAERLPGHVSGSQKLLESSGRNLKRRAKTDARHCQGHRQ